MLDPGIVFNEQIVIRQPSLKAPLPAPLDVFITYALERLGFEFREGEMFPPAALAQRAAEQQKMKQRRRSIASMEQNVPRGK